jgi:hypothetical protein
MLVEVSIPEIFDQLREWFYNQEYMQGLVTIAVIPVFSREMSICLIAAGKHLMCIT